MPCSRRRLLELGLAGLGVVSVGAALAAVIATRDPDRQPRGVPSWPEGPRGRPRPSGLDGMFRAGTRYALGNGDEVVMETRHAGMLDLPTGRLVAADPSWLPSWRRLRIGPYTATVPAGTYPVTLSLMRWQDGGVAVAAAKLAVSDEPVNSWQFALRAGEDPAILGDDEFFGVGVDVAMVCLFDATAVTAMARHAEERFETFEAVRPEHPVEVVDAGSGANLIAFNSGMGDGYYPVWVGRTGDGLVAGFVVDMLMR